MGGCRGSPQRLLSAQVDVRSKERRGSRMCIYHIPVYFLHHCSFPKHQVQLHGVGLESEPHRMKASVHPQYGNICQGFYCCSANETLSYLADIPLTLLLGDHLKEILAVWLMQQLRSILPAVLLCQLNYSSCF